MLWFTIEDYLKTCAANTARALTATKPEICLPSYMQTKVYMCFAWLYTMFRTSRCSVHVVVETGMTNLHQQCHSVWQHKDARLPPGSRAKTKPGVSITPSAMAFCMDSSTVKVLVLSGRLVRKLSLDLQDKPQSQQVLTSRKSLWHCPQVIWLGSCVNVCQDAHLRSENAQASPAPSG